MMRNMAQRDNKPLGRPDSRARLIGLALDRLRQRLPPGWNVKGAGPPAPAGDLEYDALFRLEGPDGSAALLALELRTRTSGRPPMFDVKMLPKAAGRPAVPLLVAPFVPPDLRQALRQQGVGFIDATGNLDLRVSRPALFIASEGASKNPWPLQRPARTLRSAKSARVVRVLTDLPEPLGIRQIAAIAETDPGYASRIVRLLEDDGIVQTRPRGPVTKVDRGRLVQRWSTDYSLWTTNRVLRVFEPRDLSTLTLRIRNAAREGFFRYAITGSWAASRYAPVTATRLLACFTDDPDSLAERLGTRREDQVANVWLVAPFDAVVYERPQVEQGIALAAPGQILVDLLTSPGRGPTEADAYLAWLQKNNELWRA